jgi:hypothetical protein
MGRMPESHKATLKSQLTAEIMGALIERPGLKVVKLTDGAPDNWTYLSETLPFGEECLDFYHASEHLSGALAGAYGEGTTVYHKRFETLRAVLRDDAKGPDKVIQALCRLRTRYPRRQVIHKAVAYFRQHRHRMPYARLRSQNLPIGSGVVEVSQLQYIYTDNFNLSYYWPQWIVKPCHRCREVTVSERRNERDPMSAPVLPPASRSQRDHLAVDAAAASQSPTSDGAAQPAVGTPAQQRRYIGEGGQS